MDTPRLKTRPVGAKARVGRLGRPTIATTTGGTLDIVTGVSEPGFNPLDLLYSSLAACLALSVRIAASNMGLLDRLEGVDVDVTGEKSRQEPYRILRFDIRIEISGDFDDESRRALAHAAEDICTVSNTLKGEAGFELTIA